MFGVQLSGWPSTSRKFGSRSRKALSVSCVSRRASGAPRQLRRREVGRAPQHCQSVERPLAEERRALDRGAHDMGNRLHRQPIRVGGDQVSGAVRGETVDQAVAKAADFGPFGFDQLRREGGLSQPPQPAVFRRVERHEHLVGSAVGEGGGELLRGPGEKQQLGLGCLRRRIALCCLAAAACPCVLSDPTGRCCGG